MPWPSGTPGGAASPHWSDYIRLWVRAAIGSGTGFHMGQSTTDRLDAGNVMGHVPSSGPLWVDISCDVLDVNINGGSQSVQGILSKPDTATLEVTIADPTGKYDPVNPSGPYALGGHSRLLPGTPVEAWCEVVNPADSTWTTHYLFTGRADSWEQDWTPTPSNRQTKMVASDVTREFVRMDRPEQPAAGAGDTTKARVQRIVTFFGWLGTIIAPTGNGAATLQATTLAQSGWELLNRTLDDELGYVHFTTKGELRWLDRSVWFTKTAPVVTLGCDVGHDVLTDATPSAIGWQLRNSVFAARTGGTTQTALNQASIDQFGRYDYTRTDLGLADDTQAGQWAAVVVQLYAYPQVTLDDVTFQPSIAADPSACWNAVLSILMVTGIVRVVWAPPDIPDHVRDIASRVVGYQHQITRTAWEVTWMLVDSNPMAYIGAVFTMGPDAQDRLDSNFVLGFAG
jgi:hypothetical protein